jgi:hypothetical protein
MGFTDHFNTRLMTTLNYSAIVNLHTLKPTTAHAKSFCVFTSHFLVMAANSGDSSTEPSLLFTLLQLLLQLYSL